MISGGNITVMVSNMDASVRFYTEVLGMKLTNRFGDHWATVDAARGLSSGCIRLRQNIQRREPRAAC